MCEVHILRPGIFVHRNCTNCIYPRTFTVSRHEVPKVSLSWSVEYSRYKPVSYTTRDIIGKSWADPDIKDFHPKWNDMDGNVNRISYNGNYEIHNGLPRNPMGRTGIIGRGILRRWGPNHMSNAIVTRWKRDENGQVAFTSQYKEYQAKQKLLEEKKLEEYYKEEYYNEVYEEDEEETDDEEEDDLDVLDITLKPILQMVAIQNGDSSFWAIPGALVNPDEPNNEKFIKEFCEDAQSKGLDPKLLKELFANGIEVYKGYVDDDRNTDNAWIETVACHYHDDTGSAVGTLNFSAGDDESNQSVFTKYSIDDLLEKDKADAQEHETGNDVGELSFNARDDAINVRWFDIDRKADLHKNHVCIVKQVVQHLKAHW